MQSAHKYPSIRKDSKAVLPASLPFPHPDREEEKVLSSNAACQRDAEVSSADAGPSNRGRSPITQHHLPLAWGSQEPGLLAGMGLGGPRGERYWGRARSGIAEAERGVGREAKCQQMEPVFLEPGVERGFWSETCAYRLCIRKPQVAGISCLDSKGA